MSDAELVTLVPGEDLSLYEWLPASCLACREWIMAIGGVPFDLVKVAWPVGEKTLTTLGTKPHCCSGPQHVPSTGPAGGGDG